MSKKNKDNEIKYVITSNAKDIDLNAAARAFVEILKNHPEWVDEANEMIEKEKEKKEPK